MEHATQSQSFIFSRIDLGPAIIEEYPVYQYNSFDYIDKKNMVYTPLRSNQNNFQFHEIVLLYFDRRRRSL